MALFSLFLTVDVMWQARVPILPSFPLPLLLIPFLFPSSPFLLWYLFLCWSPSECKQGYLQEHEQITSGYNSEENVSPSPSNQLCESLYAHHKLMSLILYVLFRSLLLLLVVQECSGHLLPRRQGSVTVCLLSTLTFILPLFCVVLWPWRGWMK